MVPDQEVSGAYGTLRPCFRLPRGLITAPARAAKRQLLLTHLIPTVSVRAQPRADG